MPAFRVAGSSTLMTVFLGVKSTPTSAAVSTSMGFFLAWKGAHKGKWRGAVSGMREG